MWLPRAQDDPGLVAAQQRSLAGRATVLTMPATGLFAGGVDLSSAASAVRGRLAGRSAPVFGVGAGALVALAVAAQPDATVRRGSDRRQPSESSAPHAATPHPATPDPDAVPWVAVAVDAADGSSVAGWATVRSVWAAARRLLPTSRLSRLGIGAPELLPLLDQLRDADYREVAARVLVPVVVVCGASDRRSLASGGLLARRLPSAELQAVPGAGPGWTVEHPEWLGEVVGRLLEAG